MRWLAAAVKKDYQEGMEPFFIRLKFGLKAKEYERIINEIENDESRVE